MQMIKVFLVVVMLLQSCVKEEKTAMNDMETLLNSISQKAITRIENELPVLELSGLGGLIEDEFIVKEKLIFTIKKRINKEEGILIISKILKIYLEEMRSEKKMAGYLEKNAFTYKNLHIKLFIHDEDNDNIYHPSIGFITLQDGDLSYITVSKSNTGYLQKESEYNESYAEVAKRMDL